MTGPDSDRPRPGAADPAATTPARDTAATTPGRDPEGIAGEGPDRATATPAGRTGVPAPKPGQTRWLIVAVAAVAVLILVFMLL